LAGGVVRVEREGRDPHRATIAHTSFVTSGFMPAATTDRPARVVKPPDTRRPVRETFGIPGGVDDLRWPLLEDPLVTRAWSRSMARRRKRLQRRFLFPATYI
jgi:hypothetical protein